MNNIKLKVLLPINSVQNATRESLDWNIYQSINEFLFYQVTASKAQNFGETIRGALNT